MIHEQEITLLYDHMDRNYILPPYVIDREKFDKISYGRWAIEEIIGLLADFPGRGADRIIREFAITMRTLSARDKSTSYIFRIAAETADEALALIENGGMC